MRGFWRKPNKSWSWLVAKSFESREYAQDFLARVSHYLAELSSDGGFSCGRGSQEDVEGLLAEADRLVKDDYPSKSVVLLRRARALSPTVDRHPLAAAPLACERELVALLEDMADSGRWQEHGTRRGATVCTQRRLRWPACFANRHYFVGVSRERFSRAQWS